MYLRRVFGRTYSCPGSHAYAASTHQRRWSPSVAPAVALLGARVWFAPTLSACGRSEVALDQVNAASDGAFAKIASSMRIPATETQSRRFQPRSLKTELRQATAASRTPPWLASGWGCRGRHLSRGQRSPGTHLSPWLNRLSLRRLCQVGDAPAP